MNQAYLIIYKENIDQPTLNNLTEIIRSKFVSKKTWNMFIISAPNTYTCKQIFDLIHDTIKTDILVTKFNSYFGIFDSGVFSWIKETFPGSNYIE